MTKSKQTLFFCESCGYESAKWAGQCPACGQWNTFSEALASGPSSGRRRLASSGMVGGASSVKLNSVSAVSENRIKTGIEEFDRVLGGGIVEGSLVLVGGDPGIGKSTLLTQVCKTLSDADIDVLYVSGEESLSQIKLRADRLGSFTDRMKLLCETDLDVIASILEKEKPGVAVIDSIQTMYRSDINSAPGSVSQIREAANVLMQISKGLGIATFTVGHVTKEGTVAGPRMLEHMVDTVMYFEGDTQGTYRLLRSVKNRFGSTNEVGVFEMRSDGLAEVKNPSEFMLMGRPKDASGSVVSCSMEGTRPILVEIQALAAHTAMDYPRRSASGIDYNRLNLLIAVLERRLGFKCSKLDVYVNIVGGMRINETALDLAVVTAIASGYMNFVVNPGMIAIGEIGLSGEVRNVGRMDQRVLEAKKLGFKYCLVPSASISALKNIKGIEIIGVSNVMEAIRIAMEKGNVNSENKNAGRDAPSGY